MTDTFRKIFNLKPIRFPLVKILGCACYLFCAYPANSQSIPVGMPGLEEYYRRAQLMGMIDSSLSFCVRPLYPCEALYQTDPFKPVTSQINLKDQAIRNFSNRHLPNRRSALFRLLPITWQQQFDSHHPYSLNDGAMIPARGYQTLISGGFFARIGPLSIKLAPNYLFAENKEFRAFSNQMSDQLWAAYYKIYNTIDLPERFGNGKYQKFSWGESNIRLTFGALSLGISNENLWWGPGNENSLTMGNSAPGFLHATLNTARPIRTWIGSFEGQLVCGRLENSGFAPADTTQTRFGSKLYVRKRDDWRYFNGITLNYQPRWIPGLFLGVNRTFITYYVDMGNSFSEFLPVISPLEKKKNYAEGESPYPNDQRLSLFLRWLWPKAHTEIYIDYFREDHAFDLRDIIVQAEHNHAYTMGFTKLFPFNNNKENYISFNLELTKLAQTITNPERPELPIYTHTAGVPQGYTNQGQMLGAAIGPGSNMESIKISWFKEMKSFGLGLERWLHNNDLGTGSIIDPRATWVDMTYCAFGTLDWKSFIVKAELKFNNGYNYQYQYIPLETIKLNYWTPGKNTLNIVGNLSIIYRF